MRGYVPDLQRCRRAWVLWVILRSVALPVGSLKTPKTPNCLTGATQLAFAALAGLPVNKEACGWLYCKRGTDTLGKSSRYRAQAQANFHGKDIGLHGCSTCKPLCVTAAMLVRFGTASDTHGQKKEPRFGSCSQACKYRCLLFFEKKSLLGLSRLGLAVSFS